jgi:alkylhydroperoxidase family enzyme
MSYIKTVKPEDAAGDVKAAYDAATGQYGFAPNLLRSLSLNPLAMRYYLELSSALNIAAFITAEERELVVTMIAGLLRFRYGVETHAEFLRRLTG